MPARPVVPHCLVEGGGDAAALSPNCPDQIYLDVANLEKPSFPDGYTWKIVGGAKLEHDGRLLTMNGRGKSEASGGQHLTVEGGTTFGGGAMSFCARVKYDAMQFYSRIFDFGKGEENDNIYLCNNRDSQDLKFSVRRGSDSHDVKIRNFFQPNEWVHVCATVDADGVMRIIKDGTEVKCTSGTACHDSGVGLNGHAPHRERRESYIGRSHWGDDAYFKGQITAFVVIDGKAVSESEAEAMNTASLTTSTTATATTVTVTTITSTSTTSTTTTATTTSVTATSVTATTATATTTTQVLCRAGEFRHPTDNVCTDCAPGTYRSEPSHSLADCALYGECQLGEFVWEAGTATANVQCKSSADCLPTEWEATPPTPGKLERVCSPLTRCAPGEFIAVPATATSDLQCEECDSSSAALAAGCTTTSTSVTSTTVSTSTTSVSTSTTTVTTVTTTTTSATTSTVTTDTGTTTTTADADIGAEDDADDKVYNDVDPDDGAPGGTGDDDDGDDDDFSNDCNAGDDAVYTECINKAKEAKAAATEAEAAAAAAAAAASSADNSTVVAVVVVGVLIMLVVVVVAVLKTKSTSSLGSTMQVQEAFENPLYSSEGQSQSNPVYGDGGGGGGGGHYMDVQTTGGGGGGGSSYMDVAPIGGNGAGSTAYVDVAATPHDGFGDFDSDDEEV